MGMGLSAGHGSRAELGGGGWFWDCFQHSKKIPKEEKLSLLDIIMGGYAVWNCYNHLINTRGQA